MKHFSLLLIFLILSCASLPRIEPERPSPAPGHSRLSPFPDRPSRFVHTMEAVMPNGKSAFLMGVTQVNPGNESVHCIIMTIEGLVMFDARFHEEIVVHRAIAPFDSDFFARGLMEDIRLIFFQPGGAPIVSGLLEDGAPVQRHETPGGRIVDVIARDENRWEIRQYKQRGSPRREVLIRLAEKGEGKNRMAAPERIELIAHDSPGYRLTMDLIQAEPFGAEN